jgi:cell division septum initiation protein DivIVA
MGDLVFAVSGRDSAAAADALVAQLTEGTEATASCVAAEAASDAGRRVVDLIAVAGLAVAVASFVVSIPGAVLASKDLIDRIGKRRKAQAVIDTARRLHEERAVDTYLLLPDSGARRVDELEVDRLLDLVAELETRGPG